MIITINLWLIIITTALYFFLYVKLAWWIVLPAAFAIAFVYNALLNWKKTRMAAIIATGIVDGILLKHLTVWLVNKYVGTLASYTSLPVVEYSLIVILAIVCMVVLVVTINNDMELKDSRERAIDKSIIKNDKKILKDIGKVEYLNFVETRNRKRAELGLPSIPSLYERGLIKE